MGSPFLVLIRVRGDTLVFPDFSTGLLKSQRIQTPKTKLVAGTQCGVWVRGRIRRKNLRVAVKVWPRYYTQYPHLDISGSLPASGFCSELGLSLDPAARRNHSELSLIFCSIFSSIRGSGWRIPASLSTPVLLELGQACSMSSVRDVGLWPVARRPNSNHFVGHTHHAEQLSSLEAPGLGLCCPTAYKSAFGIWSLSSESPMSDG